MSRRRIHGSAWLIVLACGVIVLATTVAPALVFHWLGWGAR
jgi:hypothetical protein